MKSIISILLSTLSLLSFGQTKLENLKFDTTITGFHFAVEWSGTYVYTPNGSSDLTTINPPAFSFSIFPSDNPQDAITEVEKLIDMSRQGGYDILELKRIDTTINGNKTHIISYTEEMKSVKYTNIVYNAVVTKDNTIIVFTSGDTDNNKYAEKFRRTLYSLK